MFSGRSISMGSSSLAFQTPATYTNNNQSITFSTFEKSKKSSNISDIFTCLCCITCLILRRAGSAVQPALIATAE